MIVAVSGLVTSRPSTLTVGSALNLPVTVSPLMESLDAVVFPGDGAFQDSMANLAALGLLQPVRRALDGRRPFLGICLGYQLLFSTSEEFGEGQGLDVIPGVVRRFPRGLDVPEERREADGVEAVVAVGVDE